MFEKVRKPGKGKTYTAYAIFGAICLVFVFFGVVPNQMGLQQGGSAAVVNNVRVSILDYSRQAEMLERQYSQQLQMLPEAQRQVQSLRLRQEALEQLIDAELVYQAAKDQGIVASDDEVRNYILNIPAFNDGGMFQRDTYKQYLKNVNSTPGQFEDRIRKDIIIDKWRRLFLVSVQPVEGETELDKSLNESKLNVSYIKFDQKKLQQSIKVSSEEVNQFLANPDNLKKAEEHFESIKSQFSKPEEVRARHILISGEPGKEVSDEKLKAEVKKVEERLKTEDFAKVAKEVSKDPGSAEKGGDLGYFSKGRMTPEFEKAAFSLEPGKISPPIKTEYGDHILRV
ncbi:MAG: SurA N-terminal domain-containing protein, partial [Bdellovibrionales bacterium]|nr:SurA N-terminal domain-containing protein [Bdellovibrionales bacterium]